MIAAVDYGRRRVGLAVAVPEVGVAHPRPALLVNDYQDTVRKLIAWLKEEQVTVVYIGRPVSARGGTTEITDDVDALVADVREQVGIKVETVEERTSTQQVVRAGVDKSKQDSAVAALLLQSVLDRSHT